MTTTINSEITIVGGGCFWCTEAIFAQLNGVSDVIPGYAGGALNNPSYSDVCEGTTGHAEVIKIIFDPTIVSYKELLDIFWHTHDPTTLNKQGNDIGTQYRSIIFYTTDKQKICAEEMMKKLQDKNEFGAPIVTEIHPLKKFYDAESYHKDYFIKNDYQPYCQLVIAPKIKKFLDKYADKVKLMRKKS